MRGVEIEVRRARKRRGKLEVKMVEEEGEMARVKEDEERIVV